MSVMAKIFIVIQAILVMVYLGVTGTLYQHKRDWRGSYQRLKERYYALASRGAKKIKRLQITAEEKDRENEGKEQQILKIKGDLDKVLNDYQRTSNELSRRNNEYNQTQETINRLTTSNDNLSTEIQALEGRLREVDTSLSEAKRKREIAELQVARLVAMKFNQEKDLSQMRKSYALDRKDLRDKEILITLASERGVNFATLLDGPPVPLVRGAVVAVRAEVEPALVLIDVGAQDEVEEGYRFSIYREDTFVGRLVVERLVDDKAACRVDFVAEGQTVQPGDRVTTRLP